MSPQLPIQIRGMAAISCFGADRRTQVVGVREGRTGLGRMNGQVSASWNVPTAVIPDSDTSDRRHLNLTEKLVDALVEDARMSAAERRECGVFAGTTTDGSATEEMQLVKSTHPWGGPGRVATRLAQVLGARGPASTYTTACTSSALALLMAVRMIREGRIQRAVVFGLDLLMKVSVVGFQQLQLYSKTVCRPFDKERNGLQIGEAVAGLILEGRKGDRPARFEVLDGAIAHDPGHIAAGSTDGLVAAGVMDLAMKRAGVRPSDIRSVKAHGTGTESNDLSEMRGLIATFSGKPPPFASLKGMFGHTLGAASVLETVMWLWCLEEGFLPASCGFRTAAEEGAPIPITRPIETHGQPGVHLLNSFGFGGTSVSYVVSDRGAA
jgi:3-oxoacyl-(acyl-carrier-protein) synthase